MAVRLLPVAPGGSANPRKRGQRMADHKMSPELNKQLRTLAHDLSNSIETIMQAAYLLAQAPLDDANKKWLELVDKASRDAARINREIRDLLRTQAE